MLGGYYLLLGFQTYLSTGGLGVEAATERAAIIATTQAVEAATNAVPTNTLFPSRTPIPPCEIWLVDVESAIIRRFASTDSAIVEARERGAEVCILEPVGQTEWYLVDVDPDTRRVEEGYMRNDVISPLNPTLTPSDTVTPLPTVTPIVPTETPVPTQTFTPDPDTSPSPTRTPSPTSTPAPTETPTPPPVRSI